MSDTQETLNLSDGQIDISDNKFKKTGCKSTKEIYSEISRIALPSIGIQFFALLQETLNLIIVGFMNDDV